MLSDDEDQVEVVNGDDPPEDTSGGPLSSGAGEGSGQGAEGAPDVDVPGSADDASEATAGAIGGDGMDKDKP
jgi:hypothetical protein